MTARKGKISDLAGHGREYAQLLRASERARTRHKEKPPKSHIGHFLAVFFFDEKGVQLEVLFIDHIDITRHISWFIFDNKYAEVMYWTMVGHSIEGGLIHVEYKEGHSIDVMRIS